MIRRSLELALGKFANPFQYQHHAEQYEKKTACSKDNFLNNDALVDHRSFFRRLLAIVRKKLQQYTTVLPGFECCLTGEALVIGVDLLRHMHKHSGSKEVRVCCKCGGRFIFLTDYEEHLYFYHLLRCVLNLRPEMDKDMQAFIDSCQQGYLIDPSNAQTFDEAAFLRGDRVTALQGYQNFLADNPRSNDIFMRDTEAMHRVLQMFPASQQADNPLLDMQMHDTLRFYDARFDAMLEHEFRCRDISSQRYWYRADLDFNCKKCAKDKCAIEDNTFDRYINTLNPSCLHRYRQAFLSNEVFLSRFPPEWLIGMKKDDYRERLPVEMGFHFWLVLIAHKLPYKHFSLFNCQEKKTQPIFMHIFVYLKYARDILQELLSDESLYYILPYTCLCRDAQVACLGEDNGGVVLDKPMEKDNVHRHIIVVFRHRLAFSAFIRRTRIVGLDKQRVQEQNSRRSGMAAARKRKHMIEEMAIHKNARSKKEQIKTKYMIPILNHAHYYHTIRYVSRDKMRLKQDKTNPYLEGDNPPFVSCRKTTRSPYLFAGKASLPVKRARYNGSISTGLCHANAKMDVDMKDWLGERQTNQQINDLSSEDDDDKGDNEGNGLPNNSDNAVGHSRFSRHFYFSIPMVYHAKPCLFLLYPHGLSDWLAESFVVKHLRYRLLRCVRQRTYVDEGRVQVDHVVRLHDVAPYLNHYIEGHGFPLKVVEKDACYPCESLAEMECTNAGTVVVSNRIDFDHVRYFDDLSHLDVRLPLSLVHEIKAMNNLHCQLVRFNLAMYKNLQIAAEKIYWLNLRSGCLSDQLKRTNDELTKTRDELKHCRTENERLRKHVHFLDETVTHLTHLVNNKEEKMAQLQKQITCLNAVLQRTPPS